MATCEPDKRYPWSSLAGCVLMANPFALTCNRPRAIRPRHIRAGSTREPEILRMKLQNRNEAGGVLAAFLAIVVAAALAAAYF